MYILCLGIKKELTIIISNFLLWVKNQGFWISRSLFREDSRYFQIDFLMANENQGTRFKNIKEEISRKNDDNSLLEFNLFSHSSIRSRGEREHENAQDWENKNILLYSGIHFNIPANHQENQLSVIPQFYVIDTITNPAGSGLS